MFIPDDGNTLLVQLIVSIVLGIVLSCLTVSAMSVVAFGVVTEALLYYSIKSGGKEGAFGRLCLFCGYLFGWILGRTVYGMKTVVVSKEVDKELGITD